MQLLTVDNKSLVTVQSLHERLWSTCTHRWSKQHLEHEQWTNLQIGENPAQVPNDMHTQQTVDTAELPKELQWEVAHPKQLL